MAQLFKNNAVSSLNGGINSSVITLQVAVGEGAAFPAPTGGDWFYLTLIGLDGNGNENAWEIVKCTSRSSDLLTIVRGQDGTAGQTWLSGTRVEMRLTSGQVAIFDDKYTVAEVDSLLSPIAVDITALEGDVTTINTTLGGKSDTGHVHSAANITSGTFDNARISQASVTQHQTALTVTESQVSDLGNYADDSRITVSASAPSGGVNGDVWYQV